jgi:hypothetical protein
MGFGGLDIEKFENFVHLFGVNLGGLLWGRYLEEEGGTDKLCRQVVDVFPVFVEIE